MNNNYQKKLIFSADDFGKCREMNLGILKAHLSGVLTSTCIMTNGADYEFAVKEVYPQCLTMGIGCHLNVIEGTSILKKNSSSVLCDSSGNYNKNYAFMTVNSHNKAFLKEIEAEFRAQIEKALEHFQIDHLNSHVHVHGIPKIFELTCKLCQEYKIPFIRTQAEIPYLSSSLKKYFETGIKDVSLNCAKNLLLNAFTLVNLKKVKKYELNTNDYFIGLLFTANMDKTVILDGLKKIPEHESVTEVLIHPYYYENAKERDFKKEKELVLTQNLNIIEEIKNLGFVFTNFSSIA